MRYVIIGLVNINLLDRCYADEHREFHYFVMDYLVAMRKFLTYDAVPHIKKYIKTNQWWDTIDGLVWDDSMTPTEDVSSIKSYLDKTDAAKANVLAAMKDGSKIANQEAITLDNMKGYIEVPNAWSVFRYYDFGFELIFQADTVSGESQVSSVVFTNKYQSPVLDQCEVSVSKVWKGIDGVRCPSSVSVQLYKDGMAYGEAVILNAENRWSYTWSQLNSSAAWTVDEVNIPEGYRKKVTHSGNHWTITNTKNVQLVKSGKSMKTNVSHASSFSDRIVIQVPQTGDDSQQELWIVLASISVIALFVKRRRH